jgi:CRP/FNR family transcriptional regulator, nitrogen oxide reductase regulator
MSNLDRILRTKLPSKVYRKLQVRCNSESVSLQDYVAKLVSKDILQQPLSGNSEDEEKNTRATIIDLLEDCPILNGVDSSELAKLADFAEYVHFPKGKIVVRIDDICDFLHIVDNGLLKVYKMSPSGREFTIDILSRGDILIGARLFNGSLHFAECITIKDSDILLIAKKPFLSFASHNPQVLSNLSGLENFRLENMFNRLMDILTDTAYERVVKTLNLLTDKFGDTLIFNHKIIAELSGTTSETVARVITQLKNRGAIRTSYGGIQIIDQNKLLQSQLK